MYNQHPNESFKDYDIIYRGIIHFSQRLILTNGDNMHFLNDAKLEMRNESQNRLARLDGYETHDFLS